MVHKRAIKTAIQKRARSAPAATITEAQIDNLLQQLTLREKISLLSGRDAWYTNAVGRLRVPAIAMTDGPHGVRADGPQTGRRMGAATCFPTGVSMAASWNPALIERVGAALGDETRAMGCQVLLGPCVNIARHPLAGRNFESFAEDPHLAGRIAVAYIRGVQSRGVGTSLKHFACNNQETERWRGSSELDERTLREIYLPQFETAVREAKPWTVMCAYNRINGVYASQHDFLLNQVLRGEWGFDGVVVSDWGANHATLESVKGGLDIEMPGPARWYGELLCEAVRNWQIEEATVDAAARRVLRLVARCTAPASAIGALNTPAHGALAREAAEQAITLLKNDGALLPLDRKTLRSLAVIGPNAGEARFGGGGSSHLEPPYSVSPLEGLREALGPAVRVEYAMGCSNAIELPVAPAGFFTPLSGAGHGFTGEYFSGRDFAGGPGAVRTDERLDFWWHNTPPDPAVDRSLFCARWTATLTSPESGSFGVKLWGAGEFDLYVDGARVLHTRATPAQLQHSIYTEDTANLDLIKGHRYQVRIEFRKHLGEEVGTCKFFFGRSLQTDMAETIRKAAALAARCDTAVVVGGMPVGFESEGADRKTLDLPGAQTALIRAVSAANPRTAVVLNVGAPVAMPWVDDVRALVLAYYPGQEAGRALARVLLGDVNPSGHLPVTFPKRLEDTPAWTSFPGARRAVYGEGVFVGYRHYDARDVAPLFPFGHGLSYTSFAYRGLRVPKTVTRGEPVTVRVTVTNTGRRTGYEVAQLYLGDCQSSLPRPPRELKGFQKVLLKPGASAELKFSLDERALSFFDPVLRRWTCEPGAFEVSVGRSSRDLRDKAVFTVV